MVASGFRPRAGDLLLSEGYKGGAAYLRAEVSGGDKESYQDLCAIDLPFTSGLFVPVRAYLRPLRTCSVTAAFYMRLASLPCS